MNFCACHKYPKFIKLFLRAMMLFFLSIAILPGAKSQDAYSGTEFWVGFMPNNTGATPQTIFVTASVASVATVSIPGAVPVWQQTVSIAANAVVPVNIPGTTGGVTIGNSAVNAVTRSGIRVVSDNPVSIYGLSNKTGSAEAYLGIPKANLGNYYIIVAPEGGATSPAEFLIVATENGTTATITLPAGKAAVGRAAGSTYTVTLNEGETYLQQNTGAAGLNGDLTGTQITSNKPIAVFGGSACANIPGSASTGGYPTCSFCDHIIDQLTPVNTWGQEFVVSDFRSQTLGAQVNGTIVRVVSSDAGITNYTITGYPPQMLTGIGGYKDFRVNAGTVIQSDKPIAAYGMSTGGCCYTTCIPLATGGIGDPSIIALIPSEQWGRRSPYVCINGFNSVINLYSRTANPNVVIDGVTYNGFTPIGATGYFMTSVVMAPGTHIATSVDNNFMLYVYGWAGDISYAYPAAGPSLKNLAKTLEAGFTNDTVCLGNTTAFNDTSLVKDTQLDSYLWNFGDGSPVSFVQNPTHTYAAAGTYTVKLLVTDTAGDVDSTMKIVLVKALPTVALNSPPPICVGDTAQITASGGDVYLWTPPATLTANNIADPDAFPTAQTTYNLRVTSNATGCFKDTALMISVLPLPVAAITGTLSVCPGGSTVLTASGGASYVWQPGGATTNAITVSPASATEYTLATIGANGCKDTVKATVVINTPPSAVSLNENDRSCANPNGSFTVTNVTGGTAPYTYSRNGGISFQASNNFSSLDSGVFSIRVRDNRGCIYDSIAQIGITQPATGLAFSTLPSGCGAPSGSIDVLSVTGGLAPYQYSKDGIAFQAGTNFTPLGSGSYLLTVRDGNGCLYDTNAVVGSSSGPNGLTPTTVAASCGASNGSLTVSSVTGGSTPYEYSIDGVSYQSNKTFNNLPSGNITVYVKDAVSCVFSQTVTVPGIAGVNDFDAAPVDETCNAKNGKLSVFSETGGVQPYQYSLDGITFQSSSVFNALDSGAYTITIKDNTGCTYSEAFSVGYQSPIDSISEVITATTCGAANGAVAFTVHNGVAPFTVTIDARAATSETVNFTANNFNPGSHNITVVDANGCSHTENFNINNIGGATGATVSATPTACTSPTGSLTVSNVIGGTAPYQYRIVPGAFNSTNIFNNLGANTYTIEVQDANACSYTTTGNVSTVNGPTAINANTVNTSCNQNNGSITITGTTGGLAPYSYSINGSPFTTNTVYNNLNNINYLVEVQDANQCKFQQNFALTDSPGPSALAFTVKPTSCGRSLGELNIGVVTGGTSPTSYSVNVPGDPIVYSLNTNYTGLVAGVYEINLRDANGCLYDTLMAISDIAGPSGLQISTANDTCNRNSGRVNIVSASGPAQPFTYTLSSSSGTFSPITQAASLFNNVPVGSYIITVTDTNGCTTTANRNITPIAGPNNPTFSLAQPHCAQADGSITINTASVTSGTPAFSYTLLNAQGAAAGSLAGNVFSGLNQNTYTLTISDRYKCTNTQVFSLVDIQGPSSASLSATASTCNDDDGTVTISDVQGGTAPYLFSDNNINYGFSNVFSGLSSGDGKPFFVKDLFGCVLNVFADVPGAPGPTDLSAIVSNENCFRSDGAISNVQVTGGTNPITVFINGSDASAEGVSFNGLPQGSYVIEARDANNCSITEQFVVGFVPAPTASFIVSDTKGEEPLNVYFSNTSTGATAYNWSFGNEQTSSATNPSTIYQDTGRFVVKMIASNDAGCVDSAFTEIVVVPSVYLLIPNSFTPEGDGINDFFTVSTYNIVSYEANIYNRWGELIFTFTDKDPGWDGNYQGVVLRSGVFAVSVKATDIFGRQHNESGNVNLVR